MTAHNVSQVSGKIQIRGSRVEDYDESERFHTSLRLDRLNELELEAGSRILRFPVFPDWGVIDNCHYHYD